MQFYAEISQYVLCVKNLILFSIYAKNVKESLKLAKVINLVHFKQLWTCL